MMGLPAGTRLGPYELVAPLGKGGMGEVYRARDTRLNRTVAVKVLPPELSSTGPARARFRREAQIASSLAHPHVCALYDVGSQDGVDYAVMEYLEGETLAQRLERGPLPTHELLCRGVEIAAGLARAHRAGIAHRDLKPGNVMLTRDGAKLLDFGLAKAIAPVAMESSAVTQASPLTAAGSIVGTCQYLSPEQVEGREADARSDIFSFGAVLYEMASGRRAFAGSSAVRTLHDILETQPEPLRALNPTVPAAVDELVRSCLVKDPDERWQSARDLELRLRSIRETGEAAGTAAAAAAGPPAGPRLGVVGVVAVALALLLGAALVYRSGRPRQSLPGYRASLLPPYGTSFAPYHFAVSPDGTRLAFVAISLDGRNTLWTRSLAGRSAQQVNDSDGAAYPFWSPDSRRIGFFANGKLKIADTATGEVSVLCDALAAGGSWNGQGTIVFAGGTPGPLSAVSERGGQPQLVTRLEPGSGKVHRWPWFLPDGQHFLFFQDWGRPSDPHPNGIYVGSLDGAEPQLVSAALSGSVAYAGGQLLFIQDNSLMAQPFDLRRLRLGGSALPLLEQELQQDHAAGRSDFSVSTNGVIVFQSLADSASELIWYTADGAVQRRIDELAQTPQLSPDGRLLALSVDEGRNGTVHIAVRDLQRGIETRLTGGAREEYPAWSPDGKTIAYGSTEGRRRAMYEIAADGSGPPRLLLQGPRMHPNHYSPDGRFLVYMTFENGPPYLGVYDRAARTSSIWQRGAEAQFSPDGAWLAYTWSAAVFVEPFSRKGPRIQVSSGGGGQPRWSGDGRRLFFMAPDRKLMQVDIDRRGDTLSAGAPRPLFQTHVVAPNFADTQYDVSRDGSQFVVNSLRTETPLTLVTGWPESARRRE